jgi:hypothetical protein
VCDTDHGKPRVLSNRIQRIQFQADKLDQIPGGLSPGSSALSLVKGSASGIPTMLVN